MLNKMKWGAFALSLLTAAGTANATTNLLQSINISLAAYAQDTTVTNKSGDTVNVISKGVFTTKDLITGLAGSYASGDVLVHVLPVTNMATILTNLVPVSTNVLVVTNTSTSTYAISNELILNGGTPIVIGNTNYSYSTNTVLIGGRTVTVSNFVTYGSNSLFLGTNTTVTTTTITNGFGYGVGYSNVFVVNAITNYPGVTTNLGTGYYAVYSKGDVLTPLNTNSTYFTIFRDMVYSSTNYAYLHGETISHKTGEIKSGTFDEIRSLVGTNSVLTFAVGGFAHGQVIPVSLGRAGSAIVYSHDYVWSASGSGVSTQYGDVIFNGSVSEIYFKLLTK